MERLTEDQMSDIMQASARGELIFDICERLGISYSAALLEEKLNYKYRNAMEIITTAAFNRKLERLKFKPELSVVYEGSNPQ